jgi:capsid portal protein
MRDGTPPAERDRLFEEKGRIKNSFRERKYLFMVNNKTCYSFNANLTTLDLRLG